MLATAVWISSIGFLGQALFFARMLLQWIQSERARKTVVPRLFWQLSLGGSMCVVAYNGLIEEPVFVLGGVAQVFIYARNLFIRKPSSNGMLWAVALGLVVFFAWVVWKKARPGVDHPVLIAVGFLGAALWLGRFVVQWWVSERLGRPTLPRSFWVLSLLGVGFQLVYAIAAANVVMIVGFAFAWVPYVRNLMLGDQDGPREDGPAEAIERV